MSYTSPTPRPATLHLLHAAATPTSPPHPPAPPLPHHSQQAATLLRRPASYPQLWLQQGKTTDRSPLPRHVRKGHCRSTLPAKAGVRRRAARVQCLHQPRLRVAHHGALRAARKRTRARASASRLGYEYPFPSSLWEILLCKMPARLRWPLLQPLRHFSFPLPLQ